MAEDIRLKNLGISLHTRLLATGDSSTETEIAEAFFPLLVGALRRAYPNLRDPHLVEIAAIDTMLGYFARPEKFDPNRSSLIGYLYMDARANLINLLNREKRLSERHTTAAGEASMSPPPATDPERRLVDDSSSLMTQTRDVLTNPADQELLSLMMDGVRERAAYAEVLGIQDLPIVEQVALVKRH
jgi:DNA-directed RNA polymerase specialized sigma24 family protein